ncbi:MAG TPA: hypothetical protein VMI10_06370 [Terriglobales bacterium]|nr:hypothetical protein [Terriglobales bacterium]
MAAMPHFLEFVTAFLGLPAMLTMLFDRDSQVLFRFVNIALTSFVLPGPRWQG